MFTGLIEEIGKVVDARSGAGGREMSVSAEVVTKSLKTGDSVSVDGACLTITEITRGIFRVFVSKETLSCTTLGKIKIGSKINLERAVVSGERFAGHFVTGHIDATGKIYAITRAGDSFEIEVEVPRKDLHFVVPKGSIAIDGVSLTIAAIRNNIIGIAIIPHTANMTTLGMKHRGDSVNLEYDIIGKYIRRFYSEFNRTDNI